MTEARQKRNEKIKREVLRLMRDGYTLQQAAYAVAEKYYLSMRQVQRVYYDTMLV